MQPHTPLHTPAVPPRRSAGVGGRPPRGGRGAPRSARYRLHPTSRLTSRRASRPVGYQRCEYFLLN